MLDTATDKVTEHELRFERLLEAPVTTVWEYLVDPELRGRWFMPGKFEPHVGGAIGLSMQHDNLSDGDVPMPAKYAPYNGNSWEERILALDPPHLLAFTWDDGKSGDVTIELAEEGDRTRLVLTHRNIPNRDGAINFGGGWHSHLAALEKRLRGEGVPDFWALHAESEKAIKQALG
jgi:uncharacterized protein YndB with AHSA1/START domain